MRLRLFVLLLLLFLELLLFLLVPIFHRFHLLLVLLIELLLARFGSIALSLLLLLLFLLLGLLLLLLFLLLGLLLGLLLRLLPILRLLLLELLMLSILLLVQVGLLLLVALLHVVIQRMSRGSAVDVGVRVCRRRLIRGRSGRAVCIRIGRRRRRWRTVIVRVGNGRAIVIAVGRGLRRPIRVRICCGRGLVRVGDRLWRTSRCRLNGLRAGLKRRVRSALLRCGRSDAHRRGVRLWRFHLHDSRTREDCASDRRSTGTRRCGWRSDLSRLRDGQRTTAVGLNCGLARGE